MSKEAETTQKTRSPIAPDGAKRPYQKPAFRYERVFETMALACGKISSTQAQCKSALKQS